jgi:CRISPR system Cascade subunit CasB
MDTSPDIQDEKKKFDATVIKWWREMQPASEHEGEPNRRGELAELKRCKTLAEIVLVPHFQVLRRELQAAGYGNLPACAAVAGVLAHVKAHNGEQAFAAQLAQPKPKGNTPRVSELRFRRLLKAKPYEELFIDLVRILPLVDHSAPVAQLAQDIYYWGDRTRRDWTFAYYDALNESS